MGNLQRAQCGELRSPEPNLRHTEFRTHLQREGLAADAVRRESELLDRFRFGVSAHAKACALPAPNRPRIGQRLWTASTRTRARRRNGTVQAGGADDPAVCCRVRTVTWCTVAPFPVDGVPCPGVPQAPPPEGHEQPVRRARVPTNPNTRRTIAALAARAARVTSACCRISWLGIRCSYETPAARRLWYTTKATTYARPDM